MPISKNFDRRKKILDKLIANKLPVYSREELFEKLNEDLYEDERLEISKRQFAIDISSMKSEALQAGGELIYDLINKRYYYEPDGFSITGVPIQDRDIEVLTQALAILKQINGLRNTRELELIISRLAEKINVNINDLEDIIFFDAVPDLKGIEHLHTLLTKTIQKQPIIIEYQPYDRDPFSYIFHPYFLKEYNNRWYVFGWNQDREQLYNVPLDRIICFENSLGSLDESHRISNEEYFKDIIGVTRNNLPIKEMTYRFNKPRANYILTKKLHSSQEIIQEAENSVIVKIKVIPNKELESLINSFGKDCEKLD